MVDSRCLAELAIHGQWDDVVQAYTESSQDIINCYNIPHDTALHVAVTVANDETEHVSKIIRGIPECLLPKILRMKNHRGNTPLHLAAANGNIDICMHIVDKDKCLIAEKNDEGETPLFLAAHRGQEDAFLYLEHQFGKEAILEDQVGMLVNSKGDTILHSVISGELFAFAIRIVRSYPSLVNRANHEQLKPLHVLALQPRSFKSSIVAQLGLFDLMVYTWIIIPKYSLEEDRKVKTIVLEIEGKRNRKTLMCPTEYKTCLDFYDMAKRMFCRTIGNKACLEEGSRGLIKEEEAGDSGERKRRGNENGNVPSTTACKAVFEMVKFMLNVPFHFLGRRSVLSIVNDKKKHRYAKQLLNELLTNELPTYSYNKPKNKGKRQQPGQCSSEPQVLGETPLLTAAKLGIKEIVNAILKKFPKAIEEEKDFQEKNAVLLAAENRQSKVYRLLVERSTMMKENIFSQVDCDGNSALHLASRYNPDRPWPARGPALQMKWEISWHEYVKNSMPPNFFAPRNKYRKTAEEIFRESHQELKKKGEEWLKTTCTAYSVISTLITTVAFATAATIPGEYDDQGRPRLEKEFAFRLFSVASLIAVCASMSATVYFIGILTSRNELEDFAVSLPTCLTDGLACLFLSIVSILVSFGSGFYFSVRGQLENAAYPILGVMCLPATLFIISQLPLYVGLNRVLFFKSSIKSKHHKPYTGAH
ncbi:hypothetical protein SAY87_021243 [Trapa incisa]|uniref:PGG domain-containing protein n=1 Tax=Trapa incisa TaxID=236973 RepID=A0AAN7JQU7_9MYRT|nr:hypothetical protein SAY87_021243 [Trapa incisa]